MPDVPDEISAFPLFEALLERRSRRFAAGFRLNGGPLAFESRRAPAPLSLAEEATLAVAANGVNGYALSELPFDTGDRTTRARGYSGGRRTSPATRWARWSTSRGRRASFRSTSGRGCASRTTASTCQGTCRTSRPSTSGRPTFPGRRTSCPSPS